MQLNIVLRLTLWLRAAALRRCCPTWRHNEEVSCLPRPAETSHACQLVAGRPGHRRERRHGRATSLLRVQDGLAWRAARRPPGTLIVNSSALDVFERTQTSLASQTLLAACCSQSTTVTLPNDHSHLARPLWPGLQRRVQQCSTLTTSWLNDSPLRFPRCTYTYEGVGSMNLTKFMTS